MNETVLMLEDMSQTQMDKLICECIVCDAEAPSKKKKQAKKEHTGKK